uniref:3-oxoacyl-[acyl-carrier protein] reductase n=1 Tax=Candidatus Kentrum sp. LFY TaxID=2126342 RepID=A0A450W9L7_9GAMM|nr:MAG: 3-oxoacyl-[acyl-carrier protein] reductase [Candidatus Kentron sp. LFY]
MITLDFRDNIALVTGASHGIGKQIAMDLLNGGARLIATAVHPWEESAIIDRFGKETCFIPVDFSSLESTREFLEKIGEFEKIDICINNAGISRPGPLEETTMEDWNVIHDVNLKAPFLVMQAVVGAMKRHHYGRIVNIASIWAHITMTERMTYTSTKFGLRGLTISAATELAEDNILVNAVSPGFTLTDMVKKNFSTAKREALEKAIPLGRLAEPVEISRLVSFLASSINTYITGQSIVIDGGYSIV